MGFKKFSVHIMVRTMLIMLSLLILAYFISSSGYHASSLLLFIVLVVQSIELVKFVSKTNAELVRFFEAALYADFSQKFELAKVGTGFEELGAMFDKILNRLQNARVSQEQELKHFKTVLEHSPIPLVSIHSNNKITLWNRSARRLFGSNHVARLEDLAQFGTEFPDVVENLSIGRRQLIDIKIDGMEHKLNLVSTQVTSGTHQETLVSMQNIQSELDLAELQAWQDLVNVLTHEIMNSITPVSSLAQTTAELVKDVQIQVQDNEKLTDDLNDISDAVNTVARRSKGLMSFVSSYRQITHIPKPNIKVMRIEALFEQVVTLSTQHWKDKGIELSVSITPLNLEVKADVHLIEQIMINLLKNAEQALTDIKHPHVFIRAFLNRRSHLVVEIGDNGKGIDCDIASNIFVPFFTTKKDGSGVGLSLTKQIMSAHEGRVSWRKNEEQGVVFSLTF